MAFQSTQKMRRMAASPSNSKASGPIRAIQTFGLKGLDASTLTAQLLGFNSQSNQGSIKIRRFSPDNSFHSRSPATRERKGISHGVGIRRTGSFDMISSSSYLNGEWPKLSFPVSQVCLTCEKSTQTSGDLSDFHSTDQLTNKLKVTARDSDKDVKSTCVTIHRNSAGLNGANPPAGHAKPLLISNLTNGRVAYHCHGSLEGLNQEIEKLVMHNKMQTDRVKPPVDGRSAPVAYQLNTCSRVTQTPTDCVLVQLNSEAEDPLRDDVHEELDEYDIKALKVESRERVDFHSPKAVTSRLPPDGCEKVEGKFKEIREDERQKIEMPFFKQPFIQFHIPSELSAFNPLVKNYLNQPVELACQLTGLAISQPKD